MDRRFIIALWHSANKGKTESLRALAILLLGQFRDEIRIIEGEGHTTQLEQIEDFGIDVRFVFEFRGIIIAIESSGDPNTGLADRLNQLINPFGCQIIFTATRTRRQTVNDVNRVSAENGFQTIWTSTYQVDGEANQARLNTLKGRHLFDLLLTLLEIE